MKNRWKAFRILFYRVVCSLFFNPRKYKFNLNIRFSRKVLFNATLHSVGDFCFIGKSTEFGPINIRIGRFCSVGPNVILGFNSHPIDRFSTSPVFYSPIWMKVERDTRRSLNVKELIIGDDVWIGARAIVNSGVSLGSGSIVAAGSVVTKDVPPYAIVGGNPAKILRFRFDEGKIKELLDANIFDKTFEEVLTYYENFK